MKICTFANVVVKFVAKRAKASERSWGIDALDGAWAAKTFVEI